MGARRQLPGTAHHPTARRGMGPGPLREQEQIFGRRKSTGAPLDGRKESDLPDYGRDPEGRVTPLDSHIRRANPRTPGSEDSVLLRRSYNTDHGLAPDGTLDVGLAFCCYQRDIARQFATVQKRLEGERFADFSTTTGGGYFLALPGWPTPRTGTGQRCSAPEFRPGRPVPAHGWSPVGSVRDGSGRGPRCPAASARNRRQGGIGLGVPGRPRSRSRRSPSQSTGVLAANRVGRSSYQGSTPLPPPSPTLAVAMTTSTPPSAGGTSWLSRLTVAKSAALRGSWTRRGRARRQRGAADRASPSLLVRGVTSPARQRWRQGRRPGVSWVTTSS